MNNEDKILQKPEEQEGTLSKIKQDVQKVNEKQDDFKKKLDRFETTQDKMLLKLLDHDSQFEELREDITEIKRRLPNPEYQEEMIRILRKLEQENAAGAMRTGRLEERVDKNENEIADIKLQLQPT